MKNRNSNIEILRIICIIFIILHHWGIHGDAINTSNCVSQMIAFLLSGAGQIGVSVFFMITGYFYENAKFDILKLMKLAMPVWLYTLIATIIKAYIGGYGIKWLLCNQFPIVMRHYNFVNCYIMLWFFAPFLKIMLKHLSTKALDNLIGYGIVFLSIIPTITGKSFFDSIFPFILFLIGVRIRQNLELENKNTFKDLLIISAISYISCIAITFIVCKCGGAYEEIYRRLINTYSSMILLSSVCLFKIFVGVKPYYNRYINYVASLIWGIFIIHDNGIIRYWIWKSIMRVAYYSEKSTALMVLNAIISVAFVLLICGGIESFRLFWEKKILISVSKLKIVEIINDYMKVDENNYSM